MAASMGYHGAAFVVRVLLSLGLWGAACGKYDLQPGCNYTFPGVTELMQLAKIFYKQGIFTLPDKERVDRVLQVGEGMRTVCPVAYLQALLIKLEENVVKDLATYQIVMDSYVDSLHNAVLDGKVTQEDMVRWPLHAGFERVKSLRSSLQFQRNFTTAMVLNFCQKEDRFGEVHALDWILRHPLGSVLAEQQRPADPALGKALLQDTDLYMYLVDAAHCHLPSEELVRDLGRVMRSVQLIPYRGGPQREEQSAYFKFIVDHYDNLPDFTIFVHPDSPEHQGGEFVAMSRALQLIKTGSMLAEQSLRYYPIALQMVVEPRRTWGDEFRDTWHSVWERLFKSEWPVSFSSPTCHWSVHSGTYLAGYVDESGETVLSRSKAKAECEKLEDACMGITCEAHAGSDVQEMDPKDPLLLHPHFSSMVELQCTLRRGEEGKLFESPYGEKSFRKNCSRSDHDRQEAYEPRRMEAYTLQQGVFLPGFAADDPTVFPDLFAAKQHCSDLGDRCAGVTCAKTAERCSCRAGAISEWSPLEEVSYIKPHRRSLPPGNLARGASSRYQAYMGSHAIVHKDRILARPQADYAALGSDLEFCSDATGQMEAMWHAFFGEPLSQWPRELDPRLPLTLKWGTQTIFHYGNEGVI